MKETSDTAQFAEHVEVNRRTDTLSDRLNRMDTRKIAGHPIDERAYAKLEDEWWKLYQQRQLIDGAILPLPITDHWQIAYKSAVIHRIVDFEPDRHDELWGQHAYQVEAWACRRPRLAA